MKKVKLAMIGVGGYARQYFKWMERANCELIAAAIPFAAKASEYPSLAQHNIPVYHTPEELFAAQSPELAVICTPIHLHKRHILAALEAKCPLLCEKPLVPSLQDAKEILTAWKESGIPFGVGYNWSFCGPMLKLKKDIIEGRLGTPVELKTWLSWPRHDSYYSQSSWRGRLRTADGECVRDSIFCNAAAHDLHNLFFIMGNTIDTAAMPVEAAAGLFRGKPIESCDTCFIRGKLDNGALFFYAATHSGEQVVNPTFQYTFTDAVVTLQGAYPDQYIHAEFNDGSSEDYGNINTIDAWSAKLVTMAAAVQHKAKIPCTPDTVMPHLIISSALFEQVPIADFPDSLRYPSSEPPADYVRDLPEQIARCYETAALPSELHYEWAVPETPLRF